jgi:hypothetical protein
MGETPQLSTPTSVRAKPTRVPPRAVEPPEVARRTRDVQGESELAGRARRRQGRSYDGRRVGDRPPRFGARRIANDGAVGAQCRAGVNVGRALTERTLATDLSLLTGHLSEDKSVRRSCRQVYRRTGNHSYRYSLRFAIATTRESLTGGSVA